MSDTPTQSKFYAPCLEILTDKSPTPMTVAQIIDAVIDKHPELHWNKGNNGPVRGMLLRVTKNTNSPIRRVEGGSQPLFYLQQGNGGLQEPDFTAAIPSQTSKTSKSIFFKPACEILKSANRQMSANEVMKTIIEQYPDLEWSQSQGPIRAMLLNAAKMGTTPIKQVANTLPPLFFYQNTESSLESIEIPDASAEEIMGNAFAQTQADLKEKLLKKVIDLGNTPFEHLANQLVAKILFGEAQDTPATGDGGIDGYINIYADPLGLNTVGVQVKHFIAGENVQRPAIQQFIGALHGKNGVFVTCSDFSKGARAEAERSEQSKIVLINGQQLVDYMLKYKVGVRETGISYTLAEIDEQFFEEL